MTQEWRGIPTRLNNIPHSREIRKYFYDDVLHATKHAIEDKKTRLQVAAYVSNSIYVNFSKILEAQEDIFRHLVLLLLKYESFHVIDLSNCTNE